MLINTNLHGTDSSIVLQFMVNTLTESRADEHL